MPEPWAKDGTGEIVQRSIEYPAVEAGDWAAVENYLGIPLPSDYKELIGLGRTLEFDRELLIFSPFDTRPHLALFAHIADASWAEAFLRVSHPELHPEAVYPEPSGILAWGSDGGGGVYHWDTADPDPDQWTVVVTGRPIDGYVVESVGLSSYLAGLADGTIEAAALSNWPGPDPGLRRL